MKPSFPPRLSESRDPLLVRAVRAAKSDEPTPARLEDAATRFKAARALGHTAGAPSRSPAARSLLSAKAAVVVAMVIALGVTWSQQRSSDGHRTQDVATSTAAPEAIAKPATTNETALPEGTPESARKIAPASEGAMPVEMLPAANGAPAATAAASSAAATNVKIDPPSRPSAGTKGAASADVTAASFDDELALVENARRLLVKGDAAGCLAELDRHRARIRGGVFEREVGVMRIEALVAKGELTRARALGQSFVAQNPDSPYADRVRSLLTQAAAPPPAPN